MRIGEVNLSNEPHLNIQKQFPPLVAFPSYCVSKHLETHK